jgi:hypothetical protein
MRQDDLRRFGRAQNALFDFQLAQGDFSNAPPLGRFEIGGRFLEQFVRDLEREIGMRV